MEKIKNKLINAYQRKGLLETIYNVNTSLKENKKSLIKNIIIVHNEHKIDVIAEFLKLKKNSNAPKFFYIMDIFVKILPSIDAPVFSVMKCVKHLVTEAGKDLFAGEPLKAFIQYCKINQERPKEALQIIKSSDKEWFNFIPAVIIAGTTFDLSEYVNIAIDLTKQTDLEIKRQSVFAIGRINYLNNPIILNNSLIALEEIVKFENDDKLLGEVIKSAFYLYAIENNLINRMIKVVRKALENKGDFALLSASVLLRDKKNKIPNSLLDILLDSLKNTNLKNIGTLEYIDYSLSYLLDLNKEEKVISFLEYILIQNKNELSIKIFKNVIQNLHTTNQSILHKLITRWFLSKKIPLYRAITDIVSASHNDRLVLCADKDQFVEQPEKTSIYAAKKAVGWLFYNPVSCISFVISLIDFSNKDEIEEIIKLLFNPLCMSYPEKVRRYLDGTLKNKSTEIKKALKNVLKKLKKYHEDLTMFSNIAELLPPQMHHETYAKFLNKQMSKAYKKRKDKFLLSNLLPQNILLYGRKAIAYVHSASDQAKRIEIPLQNFVHSEEIPSLDLADPHGLAYMLYSFKLEGCD